MESIKYNLLGVVVIMMIMGGVFLSCNTKDPITHKPTKDSCVKEKESTTTPNQVIAYHKK